MLMHIFILSKVLKIVSGTINSAYKHFIHEGQFDDHHSEFFKFFIEIFIFIYLEYKENNDLILPISFYSVSGLMK